MSTSSPCWLCEDPVPRRLDRVPHMHPDCALQAYVWSRPEPWSRDASDDREDLGPVVSPGMLERARGRCCICEERAATTRASLLRDLGHEPCWGGFALACDECAGIERPLPGSRELLALFARQRAIIDPYAMHERCTPRVCGWLTLALCAPDEEPSAIARAVLMAEAALFDAASRTIEGARPIDIAEIARRRTEAALDLVGREMDDAARLSVDAQVAIFAHEHPGYVEDLIPSVSPAPSRPSLRGGYCLMCMHRLGWGEGGIWCRTCEFAARSWRREGTYDITLFADRNRTRLLLRLAPRCYLCGGVATQAEHVHPRARFGSDRWSNFGTACRSCNSNKRARTNYLDDSMRARLAEQQQAFRRAFERVQYFRLEQEREDLIAERERAGFFARRRLDREIADVREKIRARDEAAGVTWPDELPVGDAGYP